MFIFKRIIKLKLSLLVLVFDTLKALVMIGKNNKEGNNIVLYYHSVFKDELPMFIRQMELLKKKKRLIASDFRELPRGKSGCAIVTFDDGFKETIDLILPVMEALSIPFTIFVPAGLMGMKPTWIRNQASEEKSEVVIGEDGLRELVLHPLITIGSHGLTHRSMLSLDEKESAEEIVESKRKLESIIQSDVDVISWPHGEYDSSHVQIARQTGYKRIYSIKPMNFYQSTNDVVGRYLALLSDWPLEFRLKVLGCYRHEIFFSRMKRFLLNFCQAEET